MKKPYSKPVVTIRYIVHYYPQTPAPTQWFGSKGAYIQAHHMLSGAGHLPIFQGHDVECAYCARSGRAEFLDADSVWLLRGLIAEERCDL